MAGELTRLGEVLMQGARDYANISLARESDERNRARQLEDRASAEAGEERRFQRNLTAQRADTELARDEAFQAGVLQALVQNGFLSPADVDKPDRVAAAYAAATESGLIRRYEELISQGLLKPSEVGDQAKVNAALEKMGQTNLQTSTNAQTEATRLRDEGEEVRANMQALEQRLAEPARMPNDSQVLQRAVQLAQQSKPGKTPSENDIQSFVPQAAQELQEQAQIQKYQQDQAARQQQQLLYNQARDIQQRQQNLESRFRVSPAPMAPTAPRPPTSAAPTAPRQASAEERAAAIASAIRATNPNAAPGSGGPQLSPEFQSLVRPAATAPAPRADQAARLMAGRTASDRAAAEQDLSQINRILQVGGVEARDRGGRPVIRPLNQNEAADLQQRRARAMALLGEPQQSAPSAVHIPSIQLAQPTFPGTPLPPGKTPAYNPNPIFDPPNQTPFESRLMMQPAM